MEISELGGGGGEAAGVADVFVAHKNVDVVVDLALLSDGMLRFVMKSWRHMWRWRVEALACLLLLFAFFPFDGLAAQNSSPSFEEVAAEADAARDANEIPRAIELYTQALQLNAKWEDGWWSLGILQHGSGAYEAAVDALSHLL